MDCNREEALRAKQLAEKKMENKEFSAALKLAQKAQQLHPELENISQLILVCEVHLSAEKKSYGTEKDWYAILKIDPSSDDISIKKQYRKLALILHPDKNKFSGSTDAFKLIGEAQRVLLDREKRMIHDSRRKQYSNTNYVNKPVRPQHSWNPVFPQGQSGNFAGGRTVNFQFQRAQSGGSGVRLTFWTVCPFCSVRYQFYRDDVLNKMIHCQGCKKSFVAYELNVQGATATANANLNPTRPMNSVPQRNTIPVPIPKPTPAPVPSKPKPKPKAESRKRKKKVDESSESEHSSSSSESEEEEEEEEGSVDGNSTESDENAPENTDTKHGKNQEFDHNGEQPRRSARAKRNVSYNENVNVNENDYEASPSKKRDLKKPKKPKEDTFWRAEVREPVKESQTQESEKDKRDDIVDLDSEPEPEPEPEPESESDSESGPEVYECPDPEFSDFEKDRKEDSFAPGQVWALYDTEDAMPRFYAYIRKVQTPGFNLHITWLKPVPETDDETIWLDEELPVSCGNFKRGKHDKAEDLPMFSHLVTCEGIKGIFNILPKKGETWALFKDWNMNWSNDGTGKYEYEFVEVLSDYDESVGFRVSYLDKLAGFRCLFGRKEGAELVIPGSDKYRFSHMIPSCRMSGEEREGVPKGCFELDPAGLPASVFE